MEKNVLVADEVAALLRVDKQRVYELVRRKMIPVIRVGPRQYRFSMAAIQRWLESGGNVTSEQAAVSVSEKAE